MRFTTGNVGRMYAAVVESHREGDDVSKFLHTALNIGGNIGYGTRYIGMGGHASVEFGPKGARKAVAYLYGIGVVVGSWDALRERAENGDDVRDRVALDLSMALVHRALLDLGDDTFTEWENKGREYADRYPEFRALLNTDA